MEEKLFEYVKNNFDFMKQGFKEMQKNFKEVLDFMNQKFEDVYRRFDVIDAKFEDVYRKFDVINAKFEDVYHILDAHNRKFAEFQEMFNDFQRSLVLIEYNVSDKIPALFDAFTVNHDLYEKLEKRVDDLEQKRNVDSLKISILEEKLG